MMQETVVSNGFEISPQQKRLWLLNSNRLDAAWRSRAVFRLGGPLDRTALNTALARLIARHEILRTTFELVLGMTWPLQVIYEAADAQPGYQEANPLLPDFTACWPELETGPSNGSLLRVGLLWPDQREAALLLSLPATCADLTTIQTIGLELLSSYTALRADQTDSTDQTEPLQYADYAAWQNELLTAPDAEPGRAHWRNAALEGGLTVQLPFEKISDLPDLGDFEVSDYRFGLDEADRQALQVLADRQGVDLTTVLLASWYVLLWRYSGQTDLTLGLTHAGRKYAELAGGLGLFSKVLPFAIELRTQTAFSEVLGLVQTATVNNDKWQEYFDWSLVTGQLVPPPYAAYGFERLPDLPATGEPFSQLEIAARTDRFRLKLVCPATHAACFELAFYYDPQLLEQTDLQNLVASFVTLLQAVVDQPETAVGQLAILSLDQRRQLTEDFNSVAPALGYWQCLHELVETQAARTPSATALIFQDSSLSYMALNERANQLAHYLGSLGVRAETRVGVFLERSIELVIALLGILKAGGTYIPLDPNYPTERVDYMLADSQTALLLTHSELAERLPADLAARPVCLNQAWETISRFSSQNLSAATNPQNLAYIIYTSGSTGQPKGVMISHAAISNRLLWMQNRYPLQVDDRVLQKTPFSFDASIWEFFLPLLAGAQLVVAASYVHQDAGLLVQALLHHQISILQLVPSMLAVVLEETEFEAGQSLRRIFCGGEALPADLHRRLVHRLPRTELINLYGPTEASIDVASWPVPADGDPGQATILPIGYPIANTRLYILDQFMELTPVGVAGELVINGVGLARGYLGRPDLTAERFWPDPFGTQPGSRLYRTGDLARWRSDGTLEYLGRLDNQVKIRGFRIELGEIETILSRHPALRAVLVTAREDTPGDRRLVAYLVYQTDATELSSQELRQFCQESLPDYMLPAAFVRLTEFPRLPNGKLDRKNLPAPQAQLTPAENLTAARTPLEEIIAGIWAAVLELPSVGLHANFFELGGHSLLATQITTRLRQALEVEIPIRRLFETPTVTGLAAYVQELQTRQPASPKWPPLVAAPRTPGEGGPLSFTQERLWFLYRLMPENVAYNSPIAASLEGEINLPALVFSLNELIKRHEILRTVFALHDEQPVQVVQASFELNLPLTDLADWPDAEREERLQNLATAWCQEPFNLTNGPLWRASLVRLGPTSHVLLLCLHHIVSDGWSMGLIVKEISEYYRAYCQSTPANPAPLPIQYSDYAAWQRQAMQGANLQEALDYWRNRLAGVPVLLELPLDHPRPPVQQFVGQTYQFQLDAELTAALKKFSLDQNATLFITLLSAFQLLLSRYSGQTDLVVGSPIANRRHPATEEMIGFFANTLALRGDLDGEQTLTALLKQVRQTSLEAFAYQDMPFEQLVEQLQPPRHLSHSPIFQVLFALQNIPLKIYDLPGLQLSPRTLESGTAKFDLSLSLIEQADGLAGSLEFNTALFEPTTIHRLVAHFEQLCRSLLAPPALEQPISRLKMLTQAEYDLTVRQWNALDREAPFRATGWLLHRRFEEQVARTPQAQAFEFEGQHLTYQSLNARANQLAHYLQEQGVGPEHLVGIYVERSVEMLVGLLAILKTGAAYLPLDPAYPADRLAYMLEDAGVEVVLTEPALLNGLSALAALKVVLLGQPDPAWADYPTDNLAFRQSSDNLAYVIYTSGSTGKPKGVQISHLALLNFLISMSHAPGLTAQDRLLAVTPISFDIAGLELYLPLIVGATVVIAPREACVDGQRLARLLETSRVSAMQATPTTWYLLLAAGWAGQADLSVLCGGEALPPELIRQLLRLTRTVWNMYGPTETTIWSTISDLGRLAARHDNDYFVPPIGLPIANTQAYVVDRDGQPVPVGVAGELWLGGDGLARGYWQRPALTAQRFIPDPFGPPGGRLYRTGDLARFRPDGQLECLGRLDNQVKLRGYRIELGEIETLLEQQPGVWQGVVAIREDSSGVKQLVAYLVADNAQPPPEVAVLKTALRQSLPEYMLPAHFIFLESLPQTPNGKVDRRNLPALDKLGLNPLVYCPPRDTVEAVLAAIWGQLLGLSRVSVEDNFFELGGHSLLATQLIVRIHKIFQVELSVRSLFEAPTVRELAQVLVSNEARPGQIARISRLVAQVKNTDSGLATN